MFGINRDKLMRCLDLGSELAMLVVMLREKPRLMDYLAISTKAIDVACKIYDEMSFGSSCYAWDYFESQSKDSTWKELPFVFSAYILNNLSDKVKVSKSSPDSLASACAWIAKFDGRDIGLITKGAAGDVECIFVRREEEAAVKDSVNRVFWSKIDTNNVVFTEDGIVPEVKSSEKIYETKFIRDSFELISNFLNAGVGNSYLFVGEPGTGKTSAVIEIVEKLNMKTLRIPLKELYTQKRDISLRNLVTIMKPEVLIVDDIDRASSTTQAEFLDFVDNCKSSIKVLIGTVNNIDNLISPLKRPGRFDEHVMVPFLEEDFVVNFLGDEWSMAEHMLDWPVAYISYYNKSVLALGKEKARQNIPILRERLEASRARDEESF